MRERDGVVGVGGEGAVKSIQPVQNQPEAVSQHYAEISWSVFLLLLHK